MHTLATLALTAAAATLPGPRPQDPEAPAAPPERSDLAALLEPLRAEHDLPALGGAILLDGELVALGATGVRSADAEIPVRVDDRWHLGSCTKSMTATWIALWVERGDLEWSRTLAETFPELLAEERMDPAWGGATLEMLLTNSGGAPHELSAGGLWGELWLHTGTPREQRLALVEGVLARPPELAPGSAYRYSNAGFAMAAAVAERALDVSWEEAIGRDLFAPLGMASAGFGVPGTAGELDQPRGHRILEGQPRPVELGPGDDNPSAIAPAGKVHCSLEDWARYARLHLRGATGNSELLKAETAAKLHTPAFEDYAMGWVVLRPDWLDEPILWHNGSNTMWYCELALLPESGAALMVVTNRGDERATRGVQATLQALARHAGLAGER